MVFLAGVDAQREGRYRMGPGVVGEREISGGETAGGVALGALQGGAGLEAGDHRDAAAVQLHGLQVGVRHFQRQLQGPVLLGRFVVLPAALQLERGVIGPKGEVDPVFLPSRTETVLPWYAVL